MNVQLANIASSICPDCDNVVRLGATLCVACGASLGAPVRAFERTQTKTEKVFDAHPIVTTKATPWYMRKEVLLSLLSLGAYAVYWISRKKN